LLMSTKMYVIELCGGGACARLRHATGLRVNIHITVIIVDICYRFGTNANRTENACAAFTPCTSDDGIQQPTVTSTYKRPEERASWIASRCFKRVYNKNVSNTWQVARVSRWPVNIDCIIYCRRSVRPRTADDSGPWCNGHKPCGVLVRSRLKIILRARRPRRRITDISGLQLCSSRRRHGRKRDVN